MARSTVASKSAHDMTEKRKPQEKPFQSLIFTIALPTLILHKFSDVSKLGPQKALVLALAFPLLYGLYDYLRRRQHNLLAAIGLLGVGLTGGLGLLQMDGFWFAVKEAAVPTLLGGVVAASSFFGKPVISKMLLNDEMIDLAKLESAVAERNLKSEFDGLLRKTNGLLAVSFFFSAVLNFALAWVLLKSPSGSPEFNQELAKMNAMSFVVIALPSIAFVLLSMVFFFRGLKKLTGLDSSEILRK